MSFALTYQFEHAGAVTYTAADDAGEVGLGPVERTEAWTAHAVGVGAGYSTLPAFFAGKSRFPLEVSLIYRNTVAGSGLAPHAGTIEVTGRVLYQLVGRPPRPKPDSAAVDSVRPPPPLPPVVVPPRPG